MSQLRCSSDNHFAFAGLSASTQYTAVPSKIAGRPSMRNSHCHPDSPPPRIPSNAPEIGLPITPAKGLAVMNQATARARALTGNQRFR